MIAAPNRRAQERREDKALIKDQASKAKRAIRAYNKRQLLERQTRREKDGFYGRPVADAISPSRSRIHKRKVKKGQPFGRIIVERIDVEAFTGRRIEVGYHATKGWRAHSLANG